MLESLNFNIKSEKNLDQFPLRDIFFLDFQIPLHHFNNNSTVALVV